MWSLWRQIGHEWVHQIHERWPDGLFDLPNLSHSKLNTIQSNLDDSEIKSIFDTYAEPPPNGQDATISLAGFSSFLLSSDNCVFSDYCKSIWQDMTQPISDYFISTSHNTYLVGNQLVGVSTIEGYIRALLLNCRSVESTVSVPCIFLSH